MSSGIDLINHENKIAIELKNNWKSDNISSKKYNFHHLCKFKQEHPNFEVIYGCVNDIRSKDYVNKDGVRVLTSDSFLNYIFGENDKDFIIKTFRDLLDNIF